MNKLLIVLLAVCLVSVHAFVKRDAPAAPSIDDTAKQLKNQLDTITKELVEQASKILDPEVLKQKVIELLDQTKEKLDKFKPAAAGEVKPDA